MTMTKGEKKKRWGGSQWPVALFNFLPPTYPPHNPPLFWLYVFLVARAKRLLFWNMKDGIFGRRQVKRKREWGLPNCQPHSLSGEGKTMVIVSVARIIHIPVVRRCCVLCSARMRTRRLDRPRLEPGNGGAPPLTTGRPRLRSPTTIIVPVCSARPPLPLHSDHRSSFLLLINTNIGTCFASPPPHHRQHAKSSDYPSQLRGHARTI
jgi:hypothetical protein